uniref:AN1-type domain-containing protein n=1 Tax=Elaeophora elaphi TaxID=1147741 RepID=A0A0R3RUX4_9BILA
MKEKKEVKKNATFPSNSQQIRTHSTNPPLFANVKIVNDSASQKKNETIAHKKMPNERNKNVLKALTSPGGRSPETSNIPLYKTAENSKSESQISKADMMAITIKSTVSSFKPLKLVMKKTTSIRVLKNYLQSRFGGAHQIILIHGNKELKNEGGSLASVGVTSGSVLWLLVKPVAGNNDREEIASLIRMSQSLANLRNLIRSLPSIDNSEPNFSESGEYAEVVSCGCKETEHEQMREKMKLLIERREKVRWNNKAKDSSENVRRKIQKMSGKQITDLISPSSFNNAWALRSASNICRASISTAKGNADIMKQKELATYFDPPETIKQRKFEEEEMFDVPSNENELLKIKDEIKKKRCGLCRMKLQIADREIQCMCGHVFCSKHRNPQIHRCSIDLKSVDRVHIRTSLPKLVRDISKSKM